MHLDGNVAAGPLSDIFAVQERIARRVAGTRPARTRAA